MKGLIGLFAVGIVGCVGYLVMTRYMTQDQGQMIGYAIGNPDGEEMEIHVVVSGRITRTNPVRVDLMTGIQYWDEWVEEHYELRGGDGTRVPLRRMGYSSLIPDLEAGGTPDSFLIGKVRKGVTYTFDVILNKAGSPRYRNTFIVPPEGVELVREIFEPVR